MKKIILLFVGITLITIAGIIYSNYQKETFEHITKIDLQRVSFCESNSKKIELNDFLDEFGNVKFKKSKENIGSTAHQRYLCFDDANQLLFTVVDIGNKGLVYITVGEYDASNQERLQVYKKVQ